MLVLRWGKTELLVMGRVELIYEIVDWLGFMICFPICLFLPLLLFLDFRDWALVRTWQQQGFSILWWGQNEHFLKLLVYLFISISNLTDTFYIYYILSIPLTCHSQQFSFNLCPQKWDVCMWMGIVKLR